VANAWHHPACLPDEDLLAQCEVGRGRTGGPGGQNRNKVETLIELRHKPSGVEAHAGERRSQMENRRVALRRLRLALAVQVRTGVPAGEVGSGLWRSRVRGGVISCNPDHHDYPMLLAEAMDVIASCDWSRRKAALRLDCSPTQLVRFVKEHPPALLLWNKEREQRGQGTLK